jgi:hypothetical protein
MIASIVTVEVADVGIKMTFVFTAIEVVMPIGIVRDGAVQNSSIPSDVRSEGNVWQLIVVGICIWMHAKVYESADNIKGEHVAFWSRDTLSTASP